MGVVVSLDRVVRWKPPHRRPRRTLVRWYLEDLVSDAGGVKWDCDRFFVSLPGKGSDARRRCLDLPLAPNEKRWIEVWLDRARIYVMTRQHDQFTNAIAARIADDLARHWQGQLEPT